MTKEKILTLIDHSHPPMVEWNKHERDGIEARVISVEPLDGSRSRVRLKAVAPNLDFDEMELLIADCTLGEGQGVKVQISKRTLL